MINIVVTGALWMIVLAMALAVAMRSRPVLRESAKNAAGDFLRLLPRIMIGVMGSGYIAAALPQDENITYLPLAIDRIRFANAPSGSTTAYATIRDRQPGMPQSLVQVMAMFAHALRQPLIEMLA